MPLLLGAIRYPGTSQLLHDALVLGPHEVNDAVTRAFPLRARRGDDSMAAGAKHAVGELDGRIAEIDNFGNPVGLVVNMGKPRLADGNSRILGHMILPIRENHGLFYSSRKEKRITAW